MSEKTDAIAISAMLTPRNPGTLIKDNKKEGGLQAPSQASQDNLNDVEAEAINERLIRPGCVSRACKRQLLGSSEKGTAVGDQ